ncbi:NAD(P)/FAD-dependent oxidoreductase [Candidatus Woesearchaeota archaeon]|nr:NAD(P)/FAD-dependent oxidoreductase [Candidatus Woesearchaeota archaeon]
MRIIIVGGGPVGCFCAAMLSRRGSDVTIVEEHGKPGLPFACTGIVTKEIFSILDSIKNQDDAVPVINEIKSCTIISDKRKAKLPVHDFIIDRIKFDQNMAKLAKKNGASILYNTKFMKLQRSGKKWLASVISSNSTRNNEDKNIKLSADIIIGADGPVSSVGVSAGLINPARKRFILGNQVRCEADGYFDTGSFEADLTIRKFFGWVVPENKKIARIGIGVPTDGRNKPKDTLKSFLKKVSGRYGKLKIIDRQAGLIPVFSPWIKSQNKDRTVFLLGDAAGQVKSTTGGGLIPGLRAAAILSECIQQGKNYDLCWKKSIGPDLVAHNIIKWKLDRMSDRQLDGLVKDVSAKKVKSVLASSNRDKPLKMMLSLVMNNPNLIKYVI